MAWIWFALFAFAVVVLLITYRELERKRRAYTDARRNIEILHKSIGNLQTSIDFWRLNTLTFQEENRELEQAHQRQAQYHDAAMVVMLRTVDQCFTPTGMERHD